MTTDHIEKAKVNKITGLSPSIGVAQRVADFNPRSTVGSKTGILTILRNMFAAMGHQPCTGCGNMVKQPLQDKHKLTMVETEEPETNSSSKKVKKYYFNCPHCGEQLEKLKMAHFSFNTVAGACELCKGVGEIISVDLSRLLNEEKAVRNGGVDFWSEGLAKHYEGVIIAASKHYKFPFDTNAPIRSYTNEQKNFLLYGITFPDFAQKYKAIQAPKKVSEGNFEGIIPHLLELYKKNPHKASQEIKKYILHEPCNACNSTRLGRLGREVTVGGKTIIDVSSLNLHALLTWIDSMGQNMDGEERLILSALRDALKERTSHVIQVGLDYLTLDRSLPSLSAGESQRVRLAGLLGSGLTGVLYVLDEPTTGLHPYDNAKLLKTIRMIQEAGNTKSSRSNVATYTKLFDMIRNLFANLPHAKARGFGAETFSFNSSPERCENCNGAGVVEVDMTFMPGIETECPVCEGMRFSQAVLAVQFRDYSIANILDMTVHGAIALFKHEKKIASLLDLMKQVGLEHLKLGQSTSTLSGGEAQRIKLATELAKSKAGNTLYLLDEPTTGLHPHEVEKLLVILKKLVSKGNTVVVIEHNLDVIAQADTIIDFGPSGGIAGGKVIAVGTPQEIAAHKDSLTGQCLKAYRAGS